MIIPSKLKKKTLALRDYSLELALKIRWKAYLRIIVPNVLQKILRSRHLRKLLEFPTVFQVEVTNVCNAKCWFCPQPNSNREKGYMDFNLFKKIIDEIAPYSKKVQSISFFMDGEPTLNDNILEFLQYAHNLGILKINLSSNMEFFTPELTDSIFAANLGKTIQYIICSLDGSKKEVHNRKRIGVDFEKALFNTEYLISKREEMKRVYPRIFTRLLISDISAGDIENFKNTWRHKADKVLCSPMHNWGGQIKSERLKINNNHARFTPCYFPFSQCAIQYDGIVRLCCLDTNTSVIVGDLKRSSIKEIWHNVQINHLRNLHISKKVNELPPLCANCSYPRRGTWVSPFYW